MCLYEVKLLSIKMKGIDSSDIMGRDRGKKKNACLVLERLSHFRQFMRDYVSPEKKLFIFEFRPLLIYIFYYESLSSSNVKNYCASC